MNGIGKIAAGALFMTALNQASGPRSLIPQFFTSDSQKSNTPSVLENSPVADSFMHNLLAAYPRFFDAILQNREQYRAQVIYTQIDRNKKGKPEFRNHFFNVNDQEYFYPASTVKFPVAVLALQKLKELNIPGLDMNTTMLTGAQGSGQTMVLNDPSAPDGRPTIAHYIKKILLVSDNDAFNRLYEFLGQEYINRELHRLGYTGTQIIHRLSISLSEEENRNTNPVQFADSTGKIIYTKTAERSDWRYLPGDSTHHLIGKGFMKGNNLVNQPFDFSMKNRMPLTELHQMIRAIMFPESLDKKSRFNISESDYDFLRKYMSMYPGESTSPAYDKTYENNFVKYIYAGRDKSPLEGGIRIFNKTGTAYGFLVDAGYFADFSKGLEFMFSAVIYCNSDGILNDDRYDYANAGYPFMKNLGNVIYDHEQKRGRKHRPDLTRFHYQYQFKK